MHVKMRFFFIESHMIPVPVYCVWTGFCSSIQNGRYRSILFEYPPFFLLHTIIQAQWLCKTPVLWLYRSFGCETFVMFNCLFEKTIERTTNVVYFLLQHVSEKKSNKIKRSDNFFLEGKKFNKYATIVFSYNRTVHCIFYKKK